MKRYRALLIVLAIVLAAFAVLFGYRLTQTTTTPSTPQIGTLELNVSDVPVSPTIVHAWITIQTLQVHKLSGEWINMTATLEPLDLKALTGSGQVFASQSLEAGEYTQIRFDIKSVSVATDSQGSDVIVTRGNIGLVGSFEIVNNQTTVVTLDFDTNKSIVLRDDGKYIFKPSIHLLVPSPKGALNIASASPDNGEVGIIYWTRFHATSGKGPYVWSLADGILPPGLSLDSATGLLSGTPTQAGTYDLTVQVRDSSAQPQTTSENYTIRIMNPNTFLILTTSLPNGEQGEPYTADIWTGDFSTSPYPYHYWQISVGALPPGLSLDPIDGSINGVPTQSGDYQFTVSATDSSSPPQTDSQTLTIYIL